MGDLSRMDSQYRVVSEEQLSNGSSLNESHSNMMDTTPNPHEHNRPRAPSSESCDNDRRIKFEEWGFNIDRLFEVAYRFYKRNESKAFHPSFDERNQMNALIMQARFGNHDGGKAPDIGVLDLVGKRRQYEWSLLNGMSKTEAMTKFICTLDDICPIFKAHAEAVKISSDPNNLSHAPTRLGRSPDGKSNQDHESGLSETNPQLQSIYTSLCKQTHDQFKKYAEKQHPGDLIQQKYLITSLQEQYYQQYISQMHPELKGILPSSSQASNLSSNIPSSMPSPTASELSAVNEANSSSNSTNLHAAQVATPVEQTNSEPASATNLDSGDQAFVVNPASSEIDHIFPLGGENNIEADISCEELNSDALPEVPSKPDLYPEEFSRFKSPESKQEAQKTETSHAIPNVNQSNIVELVKRHQSTEMPPIGVFESFPEPKLIQKATQRSTPIDLINPNLPTLPPLPLEIERSRIADEPITCQECPPQDHAQGALPMHTKHEVPPTSPPDGRNSTYILMESISQNELEHPTQQTPSPQPERHHFYEGINLADGRAVSSILHDTNGIDQPIAQCPNQHYEAPELWGDADGPRDEQEVTYEPLEPATIWTRGAVAEFKESLGGDKQGGAYEIKESALVIIRVPTYPDGKYIYWEFATDDYDIGFGLDFVYEKNLAQPLALNIYEDNDDDDLEDHVDGDGWQQSDSVQDPEQGHYAYGDHNEQILSDRDRLISDRRARLANTISIIPTYRRDSHEEVFVGRHRYPGKGYYLLKFDNTYSVLRCKTLYFRICYFI